MGQTLVELSMQGANRQDLHQSLRQYEKGMMSRVRSEMEVSYDMSARFYGPNAAEGFAMFFEEMARGGAPQDS